MSINVKPRNPSTININNNNNTKRNLCKDRCTTTNNIHPTTQIIKHSNNNIRPLSKQQQQHNVDKSQPKQRRVLSKLPTTHNNNNVRSKLNNNTKQLKRERSRSKNTDDDNTKLTAVTAATTVVEQQLSCKENINQLNIHCIKADNSSKYNNTKQEIYNSLLNPPSTSFSLHNSKQTNIHVSRNNNNNNNNNNNQFPSRSITDIKDDCIFTIKESESIQSKIISDTNKHINELRNQYKILFSRTTPDTTSTTTTTTTTTNLHSLQTNINNINLGMFTSNYENYHININKSKHNTFNSAEYCQLLNTYTMLEYGDSILQELFDKQEQLTTFLERHDITQRMRVKMVDWMIEVYTNIHCSDSTFYIGVNIMDRFFKHTLHTLKPSDLHLIGLCSMFISSKFCDIYPIKLKCLVEKIGHNKYTSDDILQMEEKIMKCLNYNVLTTTVRDFMDYYCQDMFHYFENNFNVKNKVLSDKYLKTFVQSLNVKITLDNAYYQRCEANEKYTENMKRFLQCVINYLLKLCCMDYEIIGEKPSLIAASALLVGMKICEEVNSMEYVNEFFLETLSKVAKESSYCILALSSKILYKAQHFEEEYPGMENLKKTHFNALNNISNTK